MKHFGYKQALISISTVLLLLVCALSVGAADSVAVQADALLSGTTVTVTISLPENSKLSTFSATLDYDAESLEYAGISYKTGDTTATNTDTAGKLGIHTVWATQQTGAATLAEVTFHVKAGAQGTLSFPISVDFATDADNEPLQVTVNTASVSIPAGLVSSDTQDDGNSSSGNANAKNPNTAGRYAAIGVSAAAALAAAGVLTVSVIKRKRSQ